MFPFPPLVRFGSLAEIPAVLVCGHRPITPARLPNPAIGRGVGYWSAERAKCCCIAIDELPGLKHHYPAFRCFQILSGVGSDGRLFARVASLHDDIPGYVVRQVIAKRAIGHPVPNRSGMGMKLISVSGLPSAFGQGPSVLH